MKRTCLSIILLFFISSIPLYSQVWVDTVYQIETIENIAYGEAIDFAGNLRTLLMDISYPTDDSIPECGRPLLVAVHGGSFITGNKSAGLPPLLRRDFAKRGYTTASINYRLGQFPTHQEVHCNISSFGVEWDCLNMADSSEWYRAYYRGIQDTHGAIRYLVNHANEYHINPQQIFIAGESAGAFIAIGTGFINNDLDVLNDLTDSISDVQSPNNIYELSCVQGYGYDTSIQSMDLERPDLGPYQGILNIDSETDYKLKGIGAFYGGTFNNIFRHGGEDQPALYLFHQPNDLIVPYNTNRVLSGFAFCATQFPAFCQYIINRPFVTGSNGIVNWLEEMSANGLSIPDYLFEHTNNNANCAQQILDQTLVGHTVDNYWLRSTNMAAHFATKIDLCTLSSNADLEKEKPEMIVYPNPVKKEGSISIQLKGINRSCQLHIYNVQGKLIKEKHINNPAELFHLKLDHVENGIYYISIFGNEMLHSGKILVNE